MVFNNTDSSGSDVIPATMKNRWLATVRSVDSVPARVGVCYICAVVHVNMVWLNYWSGRSK